MPSSLYDDALKLRKETFELFKAKYGPDDPGTLMAMQIWRTASVLSVVMPTPFASTRKRDRGERPCSASTIPTRSPACGVWPRT